MEWYNQANPTTPASANSTAVAQIATSGTGGGTNHTDLSQYTGPDWHHPAKYTRYNKNVIELPVNPAHTLHAAFQNPNTGKTGSGKYSKSSYLIIRDGSDYHAYIMTIIADSAYLKNDFSKLNRNTYSKREKDFSGMVIYQTPKGDFISAYRYTNGRLATKPAQTTDNPANISTQATPTTDEGGTYTCTDWFLVNYIDDVPVSATFLYRECIYNGDGHSTSPSLGDGGGSGGGSGCPAGYTPASVIKVNTLDTPIGGIDDGDGFPPPNTPPSTVGCVLISKIINHIQDSCLKAMVDEAITRDVQYNLKSSMDNIFNKNTDFNLTFFDGALSTNLDGTTDVISKAGDFNTVQNRYTSITKIDLKITLNSTILPNSSKEYITVTILHEALHAYFKTLGISFDHYVMVNEYIPWFTTSLHAIYSNIPDVELKALAYGGLTQDSGFSNGLESTMLNSYLLLNDEYRTGKSGIPCKSKKP